MDVGVGRRGGEGGVGDEDLAAHGGQILVSDATPAATGALPPDITTGDLGLYQLKDFDTPTRIHQLGHHELGDEFPPPRARPYARQPTRRPVQLHRPRTDEVGQITKLLGLSRLVTITGPGGAGKTRLAPKPPPKAKPTSSSMASGSSTSPHSPTPTTSSPPST